MAGYQPIARPRGGDPEAGLKGRLAPAQILMRNKK